MAARIDSPPLVLVPSCQRVLGRHPFHVVGRKYVEAIRLAGGVPLMVPGGRPEELLAALDIIDGVLLTGSPSNVHPSHFDEAVHDESLPLDPVRDAWTLPLIRAAMERGTPLPRAIEAWQAAARRWPGDVVLGMGWGNALARAERLTDAAQAFEQVADASDAAVAWNNLAQVRLQLGRLPAAREAARRAVLRAAAAEPNWLDAARNTLVEVENALQAAHRPR